LRNQALFFVPNSSVTFVTVSTFLPIYFCFIIQIENYEENKLLIFTGTFLSSFFGFGQDTLAISKSELLQKVAEKNLQIKIAEKTLSISKSRLSSNQMHFFCPILMFRILEFQLPIR
jgi:hypothetical protein